MEIAVLGIYGWLISMLEERVGKFQDLPAGTKQLVNALLGFVIPAVVIWLTPYWKPEFGELEPAVSQAMFILAPAIVWGVTQVWHDIELWLKSLKG